MLRFLSNGDYIFPFNFYHYWVEHFYIWSFQSGAPNPDGLIRLPGRIPELLVFGMFGNLGLGYFYAISTLVVAFVGFYFFCKHFLSIQQRSVRLLCAVFFALNPIFLGYISKVGLLLAVAMLPLCLLAIQAAFKHGQTRYLLLYVGCLNISLVHPFTFTINLIASLAYLAYAARRHWHFVVDKWPRFIVVGIVALLLNAYFILPLASLGTIDKGAISDSATATPVDYTRLVDIANTGNIFTAFSLSKDVLKDYDFYNTTTQGFYFLGAFLLYAVLFGVYIRRERVMSMQDKRRFLLVIGIFLLLLVLSTASFLYANQIIKFLIGMPGGWMFRSPLKWQLYIPVVLFVALALVLKYTDKGRQRRYIFAGLLTTFVLLNSYVFMDVCRRLFTPRTIQSFAALQNRAIDNKTMLVIGNESCASYARLNPKVVTELNQVLLSKSLQVKKVDTDTVTTLNLATYDYILGCQDVVATTGALQPYQFSKPTPLANNAFQLYTNTKPQPYAKAVSSVVALAEPENVGAKYRFVTSQLDKGFTFSDATPVAENSQGLQDFFDGLQTKDIGPSGVTRQITPLQDGNKKLYVQTDGEQLYLQREGTTITVSPQASEAGRQATPLQASKDYTAVDLAPASNSPLTLRYRDKAFDYKNMLSNPSFERQLWQDKVNDCNAYDNDARISMRSSGQASAGRRSLELQARNHIACTSPPTIRVTPGDHFLLSFDYQSPAGQYAGYNISFSGGNKASLGDRLPQTKDGWETFTKEFVVPANARYLNLTVYAYPPFSVENIGTARYDNFSLVRIPAIKNRFMLLSGNPATHQPPTVKTDIVDPAKRLIHIQKAGQPFYLTTKESYHHLWKLFGAAGQKGVSASALTPSAHMHSLNSSHTTLNHTQNGWYIDPAQVCKDTAAACTRHGDGTYDMYLAMEFLPQRWFYVGLFASSMTFVGTCAYILYDIRRNPRSTTRSFVPWRRN